MHRQSRECFAGHIGCGRKVQSQKEGRPNRPGATGNPGEKAGHPSPQQHPFITQFYFFYICPAVNDQKNQENPDPHFNLITVDRREQITAENGQRDRCRQKKQYRFPFQFAPAEPHPGSIAYDLPDGQDRNRRFYPYPPGKRRKQYQRTSETGSSG